MPHIKWNTFISRTIVQIKTVQGGITFQASKVKVLDVVILHQRQGKWIDFVLIWKKFSSEIYINRPSASSKGRFDDLDFEDDTPAFDFNGNEPI